MRWKPSVHSKRTWASPTILRQLSSMHRAIGQPPPKPNPVIRSPPRRPLLQLIIAVTPAREVPPRHTPPVRTLGLEARVRGAHQALAEIVEAVSHVGSLGSIDRRCVLAADGKVVRSPD